MVLKHSILVCEKYIFLGAHVILDFMACRKALDYNTSLAKPMTNNLATDTASCGIFDIQCDDCQVYHRALPNANLAPICI